MQPCSRRTFLKAAGAAAVAAALPRWLAAGEAQGKRLNFVFVLMDDLGQLDIGCFGSRFYETPNIDRLAAQGMRFPSGYAACPVCSPTRASIMAGKYPARLNITNFIAGMKSGKLIPPEYRKELPLEEFTVAEAFKEGGYSTLFLGKWHLGGPKFFPDKQGFEVTVAAAGGTRTYFSPYGNPNLKDGPPGEYLTDRLTDEACRLLEEHKEKPFLLYLAHFAVHVPLMAKKDLTAKYEEKAAKLPPVEPRFIPEGAMQARQVQDHAVYAAMVQSMDESVGRITRKLEELGIADRTAVIFMSDNGGLSTAEGSPTSNVPLRGGKGWLYEGGIREPLIVKWPGVTKPGSVCDVPVTSTDFYPTMLDMAGLPPRPEQHVDGVSFAALLRGGAPPARPAIYWHYPHYSNQGGSPCGAVRAGDWKLIEWYEDNRVELYNLKDDLGEKNDLAAKMPEKAAELRKMLAEWRKAVDARMPTPAPAAAQAVAATAEELASGE
jgi:arylsulfatase A-like enzyme